MKACSPRSCAPGRAGAAAHPPRRPCPGPGARRHADLSGAAGPHQPLSAGRRLLSQRRRAQPDHRQADLPEPARRSRSSPGSPRAGRSTPTPPSTPSSSGPASPSPTARRSTPTAVAKNFDTFGLGNKELKQPVSEVINNYDHSEVIDPLTVKFLFNKPSPGFLQGTSVIGSGLVSLTHPGAALRRAGRRHQDHRLRPVRGRRARCWAASSMLAARKDYTWGPAKLAASGPRLPRRHQVHRHARGQRAHRRAAGRPGATSSARSRPMTRSRSTARGFVIYAPATRGVNNSIVFRPGQSAGRRPHGAPGAAARDQRAGDRRHAVLGQLPAGHLGHRLDARRAMSTCPPSSVYDPARRQGLLDEAGWTLGADGILRQKDGKRAGADGLRVAAAAAEQGDAAARRPAMGARSA